MTTYNYNNNNNNNYATYYENNRNHTLLSQRKVLSSFAVWELYVRWINLKQFPFALWFIYMQEEEEEEKRNTPLLNSIPFQDNYKEY